MIGQGDVAGPFADQRKRLESIGNRLAAWRLRIERNPRAAVFHVAGIGAGLVLFAVILSTPIPFIRYLTPGAVGICAALLFLAAELWGYRQKSTRLPRAARFALPIFAFVLAAIPPARMWQEGNAGHFIVGGLLPRWDAQEYYRGAIDLNERATIGSWNQRRPLNAGINALKLRVGGGVKGWVVVSAFLLGVGLLLAGREVSLRFGPAAAVAFMGVVAGHGLPFQATTMSEPNGTLLGLLATAILLAAIRLGSRRWFWAGAFVAALALDARVGAFFTLPLLCVWGAHFFGATWKERLRVGVISILVMLFAFLPARGYAALWAGPGGAGHANLSLALYGIAAGNKGWKQVFADHPEVMQMTEEDASAFVYRRSLELILENPGRFLTEILWNALIFLNFPGVFINQPLLVILPVLILCLFRLRDPVATLFVVTFAGVVLSAPFLIRDGRARVFTASVPLVSLSQAIAFGALEVLLIALLMKRIADSGQEAIAGPVLGRRLVPLAAISLTFVLLAAPLALAGRHPAPRLPTEPVPAGTATLAFVPGDSGTWLDVFDDRKLRRQWAPDVGWLSVAVDLVQSSRSFSNSPRLPLDAPPVSLGLAHDPRGTPTFSGSMTWFVTPAGTRLPRTRRPLLLAGDKASMKGEPDPYLRVRAVFVLSDDGRSWQRVPL